MSKFTLLSDIELLDMLTKYTTEYTHLLRDNADVEAHKKDIDNIIAELKPRKETTQTGEETTVISEN